jgi:hypothetical protein
MEALMKASTCDWGSLLETHLKIAEGAAVEQIRDFRQRLSIFRYCGVDPGEGFKTDYHCNWVTTDDGVIQFLRMDMIPVGKRTLDVNVGLMTGTHEEFEKDGVTFIREVEKD